MARRGVSSGVSETTQGPTWIIHLKRPEGTKNVRFWRGSNAKNGIWHLGYVIGTVCAKPQVDKHKNTGEETIE